MNKLETWKEYFKQKDISDQQQIVYLRYINRLLVSKVPIIFETNHLSLLVGLSRDELSRFSNSSTQFYRTFQIPKKRGGVREITSPYPLLSYCQSWIHENILKTLSFHDACYGFVEGRDILKNANMHLGAREILTLDINDFFGSIHIGRVIKVFENFGYTNRLSYFLASLCCYERALPQGACTSPILSNVIAKRLDRRLSGLAKLLDLRYTRYADDITFSGDIIPNNMIRIVTSIINDEGFNINPNKTRLKRGSSKKIVTGLSVGGDKVRVKKLYKREFRKDVHYLIKNGLDELKGVTGSFDPLYVDRLIGKANFILYIEPENSHALTSLEKLKEFKNHHFM